MTGKTAKITITDDYGATVKQEFTGLTGVNLPQRLPAITEFLWWNL